MILLILTSILGVIVLVCGAVGVFREGTKLHHWSTILGIMAGIGIIGFSAWSMVDRDRHQAELIDKTDEIASLNEYIKDYIIGGDNYCFITFDVIDSMRFDENIFDFYVVHSSGYRADHDYPLYDVTLLICDETTGVTFPFENYCSSFSIGTINPESSLAAEFAYDIPPIVGAGYSDKQDFNIDFNARNGTWFQQCRFRRVEVWGKEKWAYATRVTRDGQELFKPSINPNYPVDENGEIDWNDHSK